MALQLLDDPKKPYEKDFGWRLWDRMGAQLCRGLHWMQDMKQPYLKNLSWDAQQHLNEASDNRIRLLLLQRSQAARKTTQGGPVFPGGTSGSSSNRAQLTFAQPA